MVTIFIDRARYEVESKVLLGEDLRRLPTPAIQDDVDLWADSPWDDGEDALVLLQSHVEITPGMRFYTVPQHVNAG